MNSFKSTNIIKSDGVVFKGFKPLKTTQLDNTNLKEQVEKDEEIKAELEQTKEELEKQILKAKEKYEEILKQTELDSSKIVEEAQEKACEIKQEAYEEGHSQGLQNGYEDGYKEAYEEHIEKAKSESEKIIQEASSILIDSKNQVVEYLKENKKQIIDLSITIAEKVLKEKFKEIDSMNNILESVISEYEISENFVIKANSVYVESINEKINVLKNEKSIKGQAFVLADNSIEAGNAIIETNKGRLIVGIDCVIEKVKEELL